jgi:HEAT repeat protein
MALYWTHPRVAVPLLNVLVETGKEALLTHKDMTAIAKLENCPDKARLLTAMIKTGKHYAVKHAIDAVHKEFNQDELKALIPFFIEELENDSQASAGAAIALGKLGPEAKPALPVLIGRIDDDNRHTQREVILAIGNIGGPEARKAVPKIKEQLKHPHMSVQWAAKKALRNLGL